ncbi:hypothetical protein SAMN02910356_00407 [Selenomonas sp. GACV-9]|uniref:hypothetical protein n=1 Tax=Selenomonas sp. GACV-9 TaxID=3158782 RepID=UPI0008EC0F89|nr:hypothetical protein SAMN02910356_00407 [Selenomonas ruminantium]
MRKSDVWYELAAGKMPKLLADKLEPFGFRRDGDAYFYAEELLAGSFHGPYVEELLQYVQTAYGDELEYLWKDMDAAVIRSHLS